MNTTKDTLYYTLTDEAPALATASFLPILEKFAAAVGLRVEEVDISLAGRIISSFAEYLSPEQRIEDGLASLAQLTADPDLQLIKLPNISASLPQLIACIGELNDQGYAVPAYPETPANENEKKVKATYDTILGSAVNPVLRQGNSVRRAPQAVKSFAKKNPHSISAWSTDSQAQVAYMKEGDFFSEERSFTAEKAQTVQITFTDKQGNVSVKKELLIEAGEVIDAMRMKASSLRTFFEESLKKAKQDNLLWSLHLKATMMKVSHPIVFGHAITVFFDDVFEEYGNLFGQIDVNPNNGLGDLYRKISDLPAETRQEIEDAIRACYTKRPALAMVNSDQGITNLHFPNDIIVDASIPAMIRAGGKMWGPDGTLKECVAVMPESTYSVAYEQAVEYCRAQGAFDPTQIGSVENVGLMAKKAEEYGSHDKTFEVEAEGSMSIVSSDGTVLTSHTAMPGDIWRMCQTKMEAINDWVVLAVERARSTQATTIFWLNEQRAHDRQLLEVVQNRLESLDTTGLDIRVLDYAAAMRTSMELISAGEYVIAVTGNVLRDYLTDLFPIIELGTSAKMLSQVKMLKGGMMFETGAGGSAPKHVQQLVAENHLRWDSLGEFLAVAASLRNRAEVQQNTDLAVLGETLDAATETLLLRNLSPSRKVGELDSRGSHFYLTLFWAQELAAQRKSEKLAEKFAPLAQRLAAQEDTIIQELNAVQGSSATELDGYYHPSPTALEKVMRPSSTFNASIESFAP